MTQLFRQAIRIYGTFRNMALLLQSPLLLIVRLYWGWQFAQSGWGKLHSLAKVTNFFSSLGIPMPGLSAHFVAGLEFLGGILLIAGLFSRLTSLLLTCNMLVAFITADQEALHSIFSDPGKFYDADPYTFLFAAVLILVFGPGRFALDQLLVRVIHISALTTSLPEIPLPQEIR